MLGQPASSHTVCRPSRFTRLLSSVYSGPIFALILIHGGLRSIGVSALRTSRRSSLRPSGWMAVTDTSLRPGNRVVRGRDQRYSASLTCGCPAFLRARAVPVECVWLRALALVLRGLDLMRPAG